MLLSWIQFHAEHAAKPLAGSDFSLHRRAGGQNL
jgi:hypothetical protein